MSEQRKVSFKQELLIEPGQQTTGLLEVKGIVMTKDFPMNGIYIPLEVFRDGLELWVNAPVVAPDHVEIETVANTFGKISRALVDDDELKADGVFDLDKLAPAYPILFDKLINGQPVSGSIEVLLRGFDAKGDYNGRGFNFIATKILKVHHYALLQDVPAACDVVDGCGIYLSAKQNIKEVTVTKEQLEELVKELKATIAEEVKTFSAKQGEATRPEKLDVTHVTPCEFSELVGRVTANEATTTKLQASYEDVSKLNGELKAEIVTLQASLTQDKNNNTGVDVSGSTSEQNPDRYF